MIYSGLFKYKMFGNIKGNSIVICNSTTNYLQ